MSYCCGATMICKVGTLRHGATWVHNVPLYYCPVCHQVEVHPKVKNEFDLLVEYAQEDSAREVNLKDYIDEEMVAEWKENCTSFQEDNPEEILQEQIDMALDLLGVAKQLGDNQWVADLKYRLQVLSSKLAKLKKKQA